MNITLATQNSHMAFHVNRFVIIGFNWRLSTPLGSAQNQMDVAFSFHHTDTWIDTTSANRHHPGESLIRFIFTTFAVLVVGSPMWMVFLY